MNGQSIQRPRIALSDIPIGLWIDQMKFGETSDRRGDSNEALGPGQRGADTQMNPLTKGHVTIFFPLNVEDVGI